MHELKSDFGFCLGPKILHSNQFQHQLFSHMALLNHNDLELHADFL